MKGERGERLFTGAALGLAVLCAGFGSLMVVRLERMANPPLMMGLDFSSLRENTGADPAITGTIGRKVPRAPRTAGTSIAGREPQHFEFRLLSVVDGIAFVEVGKRGAKELWPVEIGATLPGAGEVIAIKRIANRWHLRTPSMTISAEAQ